MESSKKSKEATMRPVKTTTAREGRANQLYNPLDGNRVVAGCVVLTPDCRKVVMISSMKHKNKWIIPKGGVERDEANNYLQAACRETWEESGCSGTVNRYLGQIRDTRREVTDKIPRCEFHFYQLVLQELSPVWPEQYKRNRECFDYTTAKEYLQKANRPELLEALERSDIVRN